MLLGAAMAALFYGVVQLRGHDYISAVLLMITGLSILRAGVDLLRPSLGE